jgi:hypothetical protein
MTHGTSAIAAKLMCSCIREKPGPLVAVIALSPPSDAPITAPRLAISSSIWMKTPPAFGMARDICSMISVAGVMG